MKRAACFLSGTVVVAATFVVPGVAAGATRAKYVTPAVATQANRNSIGGMVMGPDRRPLADVYVELASEYNSQIGPRQRTNSSGRYHFSNLPEGRYKVRVLSAASDFEEQTQEVVIQNAVRQLPGGGTFVSGFESAQLDITMRLRRPRSGEAPKNAPGTIFAQVAPEGAKRAYEQAVADLDVKKDDAAGLAGLKKAVEMFPTYYDALLRLGTEHLRRQTYTEALAALNKAVEVNPRGYAGLYGLGVAQHYLRQRAAAAETFRRAVNLNPGSVNAQIWLGIALRLNGQFAPAEAALKRARELGGGGPVPEVHWQLSLLFHQQRRYNDAANELELFLKASPDARDAAQIGNLIRQFREQARATKAKFTP
ncbi:MAG TPA: tetratricopeptide repeat protein [Pyrinomonadaceae bacterium]